MFEGETYLGGKKILRFGKENMFMKDNESRYKVLIGVDIKKFITFDTERVSKENTCTSLRIKLCVRSL